MRLPTSLSWPAAGPKATPFPKPVSPSWSNRSKPTPYTGERISSLRFDMPTVKRLQEHALACTRHWLSLAGTRALYGDDFQDKELPGDAHERAPAVLHFAKEHGVYLTSSGLPRQTVDGKEGSKPLVCYADGCDPNADPDWYDEARLAAGGDDFVEDIPCETIAEILEAHPNATHLLIDMYEKHYSFSVLIPPSPAPTPEPA